MSARPVFVFALFALGCGGQQVDPRPGKDITRPEVLLATVTPGRVGPRANVRIEFGVSEPLSDLEVLVEGAKVSCSMASDTDYSCPHQLLGSETDGPQQVTIRAADAAGNVGEGSTSFVLDATPPSLQILKSPPPLTNLADGTVEFQADEEVVFSCALDGAAPSPCSSPYTFTRLAETTHYLLIRARDLVGNVGETTFEFRIDATPPDTRIDSAPPLASAQTRVEVTFSATEDATFACRLDAAEFAPCTSPVTLEGYAEGQHRFEVRSTDRAGSVDESPAAAVFTFDATAPRTTLETPADDGSADRELRFAATEDASFACRLDDQPASACSSPWTLRGLADGTHSVSVQATDVAGNVEAVPATAVFLVDRTGPTAYFTKTPADPLLGASAVFEFAATEPGSTFECRLDAQDFAPCTSPAERTLAITGLHSFEVRATDRYGNVGEVVTLRWAVDLELPQVTLTAQPQAITRATSASVSFQGNKQGLEFSCALDAAPAGPCTSPWTKAGLADGAHILRVTAADAGGRTSAPAEARWTVDTKAPRTTLAAIPDTGSPSRTVAFSASEGGCTFECGTDGGPFSACSSPATLTVTGEGSHTVSVRATDAAGNVESPAVTGSFLVDQTPPVPRIVTGPPATSYASTATFTFDANEVANFECRLDAGTWAPCSTPRTVTVATDGLHAFEVRATDKYGNASAPVRATWTVDAFPPTVRIDASPTSPTRSTAATVSFSANKPGVTFSCTLDGGAAQACTSPRSLSGLADGAHTFTVVGTDGGGRASAPAAATWTVDTVPPTVWIQSSPPALGNQASVHFAFVGSEPGCSFECSRDGGAFAACPGSYDFVASEGAHTLSVRAVDPAGNKSAPLSATFEVDLTPPAAPAIDQPDPSLTSNTTPTLTWSPAPSAVSYSVELSTTEDFGQIAQARSGLTSAFFVPTPLSSSRYFFRVKARDAAGNDSLYSRTGLIEVRTWGFLNPRPQGATLLAVACLNAQTCWFVGEAGVALRTNDGGGSFKQASTGIAGNLNALHVFDATTALAVGAAGAILRTTDGGVTWFAVPSGVGADLWSVRFKGQTGFAVGDSGTILRSLNGGLTWQKLAASTTAALRDLALLDESATTIVAVGGTGAVLRSENGGTSWVAAASGTSQVLRACSFPDATNGYAVGPGGTMRKTTDAGRSWQAVVTGTTKDLYGVRFRDPLEGFTLGDSDNSIASLRATADGGVTWTGDSQHPLFLRPSLRAMAEVSVSVGYAVGDGGNVLKTTDGWATYQAVAGVTGTLPLKTDDQEIRVAGFPSATTGWLFGGTGFAVKTSDGGASFQPLDAALFGSRNLYAASFLSGTQGWVGGDSGFVARTTDGVLWSRVTLPTGLSIYVRGMHFPTASFGVLVGTSGKIAHWDGAAFVADASPVTSALRSVRMADPSHGYAVGDTGVILGNAGTGWVVESLPAVKEDLFAVWTFDATRAIAVGDKGRLLRRSASGWTAVSAGTSATLKDIGFADAQHGWIVGNGTILVTSDGGQTWQKQLSPTGSTLQSVAAVTPDVAYAVGSSRNVIKTTLGGR